MFGARRAIDPLSGAASIAWYRYWHYAFLKRALEHTLASEEPTVVYAQCTLSAKAAIEARAERRHQGGSGHPLRRIAGRRMGRQEDARVGSQRIRSIVDLEQRFLPQVDGIVYVSDAARKGMTRHVRGLDAIPSSVVSNFVAIPPPPVTAKERDLITVGGLEIAKNQEYLFHHRGGEPKGPPLHLDLAGDGPCRGRARKFSKSLGLEGQVRFLGSRNDVR